MCRLSSVEEVLPGYSKHIYCPNLEVRLCIKLDCEPSTKVFQPVKNLIVERYPERLGAPKAHALSPRSLEICRQFGLDVSRIRQLGTKRADAFWVNFLTNLSGEQVGVLPYERMDHGVLDETPEVGLNILKQHMIWLIHPR
jgi:hypothetical protein